MFLAKVQGKATKLNYFILTLEEIPYKKPNYKHYRKLYNMVMNNTKCVPMPTQ